MLVQLQHQKLEKLSQKLKLIQTKTLQRKYYLGTALVFLGVYLARKNYENKP